MRTFSWPVAVRVASVRPWNEPSAETISERAPPWRVAPASRELDRRLVRLGAAVAEEHAVGERVRAEQLGEPRLRLAVVQVRDVEQLRGLAR